ncbi:hypothetical protein ECZC03_47900 [Escherichia coli]|nr:hypothetical protein ECZC03_47900 [Escherichia coli]
MGLGTSILDIFEGVVTKTDEAMERITQALSEFMGFNLNPDFCIAKSSLMFLVLAGEQRRQALCQSGYGTGSCYSQSYC